MSFNKFRLYHHGNASPTNSFMIRLYLEVGPYLDKVQVTGRKETDKLPLAHWLCRW